MQQHGKKKNVATLVHRTTPAQRPARLRGLAAMVKGEPIVRTRPCSVCGQPVAENERRSTTLFMPRRWAHLACLDAANGGAP